MTALSVNGLCSWCAEWNRALFCSPIIHIANFLTLAGLYKDGYQYRSWTLTILLLHLLMVIMMVTLGLHPTIIRLMNKALSKATATKIFLYMGYVQGHYLYFFRDSHFLSLKPRQKLVRSLAPMRPSRSHNPFNLDLRKNSIKGVQFKPCSLAKQSRSSKPPVLFVFPANKKLCSKEALQDNTSRMEFIEAQNLTGRTRSFCKYNDPISSSLIARRIMFVLSLVSININRFKANSVKSASTSMAASARVTTNQTMVAADSTGNQNLLLAIYYKPSLVNVVQRHIQSCHKHDIDTCVI